MLGRPDTEIAMRDAAVLFDSSSFGEYKPGATLRKLAEVYQMPVIYEAVLRRVGAHRRDDDPVADCHATKFGGREQERAGCH